jgi:hypothetical protein
VTVSRGGESATVRWPRGESPGTLEVTTGARSVTVHPTVQVMRVEDTGPTWGAPFDPAACVPESAGADYHTIAPCRAFDSRAAGSPLAAGQRLLFLSSSCPEIPPGAVAVTANATVVSPGAAGHLSFQTGGCGATPASSVVNFRAGLTRASFTMLPLSVAGNGTVAAVPGLPGGVGAHVVVDVTGYFAVAP